MNILYRSKQNSFLDILLKYVFILAYSLSFVNFSILCRFNMMIFSNFTTFVEIYINNIYSITYTIFLYIMCTNRGHFVGNCPTFKNKTSDEALFYTTFTTVFVFLPTSTSSVPFSIIRI